MRDLCRVIEYLLENVIPKEGETSARAAFTDLARRQAYRPPESQQLGWQELMGICRTEIDDPVGTPWKERLRDIVNDVEKIPS